MPLIYGEGDRAFLRLREQIQATEENDELVSLHSDSSTTLVEEILTAANEFVSLLIADHLLNTLLSDAFDHIEPNRLKRIIKRLLRLCAVDLRQETQWKCQERSRSTNFAACKIHRKRSASTIRYIDTEQPSRLRFTRCIKFGKASSPRKIFERRQRTKRRNDSIVLTSRQSQRRLIRFKSIERSGNGSVRIE